MRRVTLNLLLVLCLAVPVVAQRVPRRATPEVAVLSAQLAGDQDEVRRAIPDIVELLETQPATAASQLRWTWLNALIKHEFYEDAEKLALAALAELAHDTVSVEQLQRQRIRAFLAAGKTAEALSAAKGLYNVASLGGTRAAILQVAECLSAVNPDDPAVINRFRREQMAGSRGETTPDEDTLRSIAVDPAPFAAAIARYDTGRYTIESNPYRNRVALGNLLLLCDRADEARPAMESAMRHAPADAMMQARENVARAIKAQTRGISEANAYMQAAGQQGAAR